MEVVGIDLPFCVHASSMPGEIPFDKACKAHLRGNFPGNFSRLWYDSPAYHAHEKADSL
jgi:hypothetical protein